MADSFWEPPASDPCVSVLLYAPTGTGKTYWSLFAPDKDAPIWVIDTDRRAEPALEAAVADQRDVRRKRCGTFGDVRKALSVVVTEARARIKAGQFPGTLVFDSGSDLQDIAADEYLAETGSKKVYPLTAWSHVFAKIEDVCWLPFKLLGLNIVIVGHEKDVYAKNGAGEDVPTGETKFRGYKKFMEHVDVILYRHDVKGGERVMDVEKNGFALRKGFTVRHDVTLRELVAELKKQG